MRPRARAAVHIGRELRLSKVFVCVFALWAIILSTAACSPSEPAVAPAEPTLSPAEADLTARRTAVQRRRESEELPVGVDEHVLVQAGDQVEVD